jgi:RNA polymerase sigma factor (sigma-70 family)
MTSMTDLEPMAAGLAADLPGTFPELVRELSGGLYSGALRMLGDRQDAEDVTQEALVRAYRALEAYPADRIEQLRLRGWMWTITANLCRNRLRQRSRRPTVPIDPSLPADPSAGPADEAIRSEAADELAAHLLSLPWPMRSAVVLRHVAGLGVDEIAAALDRPPGTVRSDIHRGLARLRALYTEELR